MTQKKNPAPILVRIGVWVTMICLGIVLFFVVLGLISAILGGV